MGLVGPNGSNSEYLNTQQTGEGVEKNKTINPPIRKFLNQSK